MQQIDLLKIDLMSSGVIGLPSQLVDMMVESLVIGS
jgi:hypothetical protein